MITMKKIFYIFSLLLFLFVFFGCNKSTNNAESFEDYIASTDFTNVDYDSENDVYIVSIELNDVISDENAIQNFNDSVYDVIHSTVKPDKDVIFRAWDGNITASLIYFKKEKFEMLSDEVFDSKKTYIKANGWQTISKFGQYQTLNDYSESPTIEELLFNLSMMSR